MAIRQVSELQVRGRLLAENPWWQRQPVQALFSDLSPRGYFDPLYDLVTTTEPRRAVVLMGPRRVGKTVMIHHEGQARGHDRVVRPARRGRQRSRTVLAPRRLVVFPLAHVSPMSH